MAATPKNNVAGTWRLVSAQLDPQGANTPIFGSLPSGLLVFTDDMHYVELLHDSTVPKFAANGWNQGTAAENTAAVVGSISLYGTYTVDEDGNFYSEHVLGSTFPNWNGLTRGRSQLAITVEGDRMTEHLTDPGAPLIVIEWQRVKEPLRPSGE